MCHQILGGMAVDVLKLPIIRRGGYIHYGPFLIIFELWVILNIFILWQKRALYDKKHQDHDGMGVGVH